MRLSLLIALVLSSSVEVNAQRLFRQHVDAMGSVAEVLLYADSPEDADSLIQLAFDEIRRVEQMLNVSDPSSELARLSASTGEVNPDPEMIRILNRALGWARQSGGALDPTAGPILEAWSLHAAEPGDSALTDARSRTGWQHVSFDLLRGSVTLKRRGMQLNAAAFQQGYALDQGARVLKEAGVQTALLEFSGGTYLAIGSPPRQQGWLIHVDDPTTDGTLTTSVYLSNQALATTRAALDPRTGKPATAAVQVSVLAATAMDADALSTTVFVLGPEASESFLAEIREASARILYLAAGTPAVRTIRWD